MLKSMTGFAKAAGTTIFGELNITIKTYNNKFCDISFKMPRFLYEIENELTIIVREQLQRGKIYVNLEFLEFSGEIISLNANILKQYISELKNINQIFKNENIEIKQNIDLATLLRLPEIICQKQPMINLELLKKQVIEILTVALNALDSMRAAEATNLMTSIITNINMIRNNIEIIKTELPQTIKNYKEKLHNILNEYKTDLNEDTARKIMLELSFFTEKIDVSEELERMKSHLKQFEKLINDNSGEPSGKTLEFLLQELNREINTCSVKSMNAKVSQAAVDIKNLLDKIKEQIMNIV